MYFWGEAASFVVPVMKSLAEYHERIALLRLECEGDAVAQRVLWNGRMSKGARYPCP